MQETYQDLETQTSLRRGAELIQQERWEQIYKHGYDLRHDLQYKEEELIDVALFCILRDNDLYPKTWNERFRDHLSTKTDKQRYIMAGAFLAAQIDLMEAEDIIERKKQKQK